jgi:hypothetical protein
MQITKVQEQKNGYLVNDSIFVPNAQENSDYQAIQKWIADGGIIEAFDFLAEAKLAKIAQLKTNRNEALGKPYSACKAYEWDKPEIEENKVYFEFSAKATGVQLTEPSTIIFSASLGGIIKYSCTIIEGENKRKGYVILDQAVSQNVSTYLEDRGTTYISYANEKEVEINACTTLEELNAININFE